MIQFVFHVGFTAEWVQWSWKEISYEYFPFQTYDVYEQPNNSTMQRSWKESYQGSWKEPKIDTFGNKFLNCLG